MYPRWRGSRLVAFIEACRSLQIISWITVDLSVFERFASAQTSPPQTRLRDRKGPPRAGFWTYTDIWGCGLQVGHSKMSAPPFQSGKPGPRTQPSIPCRISPGQALATERLSLHASMLRALECLYKSRNVHERPSFCHRDGNGTPSKRPRRTPSALSAGPIPRGPAPRTQKSPRRGPVRCLQGGLGKRTGPGEGSRGGGVRRPEGRAPDSSG